MKSIAARLLLLAVLWLPVSTHAETVLRTGDNISVDAHQVVDGNYYVSVGPFGNTTMSGNVKEDMYALGGTVTINGPIGSDLSVVGGSVQVYAPVTGDVRIVAGDTTIANDVGGDLFVVGGRVQVLSTAHIAGNVFFFGGQAQIDGSVGGSIMGSAKDISIDADVAKNVDVRADSSLTLKENANIHGSLGYSSPHRIIRSQTATVVGEVTQNSYGAQAQSGEDRVRQMLVPLFVLLFTALSLYVLFRKELQGLVEHVQHSTLKSAVIGLCVLVLGPIAAVLLMATVLGFLVGVVCLALVILGYAIGFAASGIVLGGYLSKWFRKKAKVSLHYVILGTLVLGGLLLIPVVGYVIVGILLIITTGSLVLCMYKLLN